MQENDSETVALEVGDYNKLVLILGQWHRDPLHALREFVQNARDAIVEAGRRGQEALVRVHLEKRGTRRRPGRILISDSGIGMAEQKMRRIPAELCSSEKLEKLELEGRFGVGLLSYVSLAERCEIVSRGEEEKDTWRLILPSRVELERAGSPPAARIHKEQERPFPGTDVYLEGLHKEILTALQPSKVARYLARHYGSQVRNHQIRIEVTGKKGKRLLVKPVEYRGQPFQRRVRTEFGHVEFELYLNARPGDQSIQLAVGPTVIGDIAESVPELNRSPWRDGRMEGEIRCGFIEPLPHRQGVKPHTEKFPAFLRSVAELEPELQRELTRISARRQKEAREQALLRIQQAFHELSREQNIEHQFRVAVADPEGEQAPGEITDEKVPGGRQASKGKDKGATLPKIRRSRTSTARQRLRKGLDLDFEEWEPPEQHSKTTEGVIYINQANPDYRKVEGDPSLYGSYVVTCAMKEVCTSEYGGVSETSMEEYLSLLLGMQRILKMGVEIESGR